MRVIFLDIDGVLNSQYMYQHYKDDIISTPSGKLSKMAIENLNSLTDATDAKLVISSTWRFDDKVIESLREAGITGTILGITGRGCACCLRGNEIRTWIHENIEDRDYHNYLILDDDSDMLYWQRNNFINVDYITGITPQTVYKAERFFAGKGL